MQNKKQFCTHLYLSTLAVQAFLDQSILPVVHRQCKDFCQVNPAAVHDPQSMNASTRILKLLKMSICSSNHEKLVKIS